MMVYALRMITVGSSELGIGSWELQQFSTLGTLAHFKHLLYQWAK